MAQQKSEESRVPLFSNEQQAAEFWDSHSPLDFPEEFHEVQGAFEPPRLKRGLTIRLDPDTVDQLRIIAKQRGIGPSTLARMWILEHLQHESSKAR